MAADEARSACGSDRRREGRRGQPSAGHRRSRSFAALRMKRERRFTTTPTGKVRTKQRLAPSNVWPGFSFHLPEARRCAALAAPAASGYFFVVPIRLFRALGCGERPPQIAQARGALPRLRDQQGGG
ncbi:hypothetical protein I41_16750 [Lacipirellula limnantheis]|uniref:Uncharacterized protein n=1 Tax=Lacipirellula limnantheis TaxID=2528024 RepID=A0A517TVV5_9BACT|nr:hypothetical protein I41_16750 [Lacipirellula limnantheis]